MIYNDFFRKSHLSNVMDKQTLSKCFQENSHQWQILFELINDDRVHVHVQEK